MRVIDLIEYLKGCDENMEVHIAYGSGDYWRTTVAPRISQVSEGIVEYSEYHRMDQLKIEEDYDDEDESVVESQRRVLIIE